MRVDFPSTTEDFRTWEPRPGDYYSALGPPASLLHGYPEGEPPPPHHEWDFASVFVVRVVVDIDDVGAGAAELAAAKGEDDRLAAVFKTGTVATSAARDAARSLVEDIVAWARAEHDQSWLGLSSEVPEMAGPTEVLDLEANTVVDLNPPIWLHGGGLRNDSDAVDARDLDRMFDAVSRSESPPLAHSLLADAEYLAWDHYPPDPVRAVLMAAIASEVKVKTDLVSRARPEEEALITFILKNQREVTLTAVDGLFDKLMMVAQGRSLRKDDKQLFEHVKQLFTLRNRIAHDGVSPDLDAAQLAVQTARKAIAWVDAGSGAEPQP